MILDVFLAVIFLSTAYLLWVRFAEKIPELVAIPDSVITERLREDSTRIHRLFLHAVQFRELYRARHYQDKFWRGVGKFIYRIHIFVLRLDNRLLQVQKRIQKGTVNGNGGAATLHKNGSEYWKRLSDDAPPSPHPQVPYASEIKTD